jgi:hypothetical protein
MTDRELLEMAAKAAGMADMRWTGPSGLVRMLDPTRPKETGSIGNYWNPLTDDGDALRLAVKLFIDIRHSKTLGLVEAWVNGACIAVEEYIEDKESAIRRAIVCAAAAIGESL